MTDILKINESIVPKFPKHVRFRFNKPRKEWVILAPERLVKMDPIAVEILQLVDGERTVKNIASELSEKFNAPLETILADVIEMLQETYYPGHATTAKRVIERHLIREFGLKPREATYHGGNIIDELQVMGILQRVPEDVIRNALLTIDIRKLQAHKA